MKSSWFGDEAIRQILLDSEARGLSPTRIRFWQLVGGHWRPCRPAADGKASLAPSPAPLDDLEK
jgi:hypothetical protein